MFDAIKVKDLFLTEPNTAYFWSGLGANGAEIAEEMARASGGTRIHVI